MNATKSWDDQEIETIKYSQIPGTPGAREKTTGTFKPDLIVSLIGQPLDGEGPVKKDIRRIP